MQKHNESTRECMKTKGVRKANGQETKTTTNRICATEQTKSESQTKSE